MKGTQSQMEQQGGQQAQASRNDSPAEQEERNAWQSLVLALDGGGVRGLSSLYILRDIMHKLRDLDEQDQDENNRIETGPGLPLPCNYFDFIIGTSTGGLIAIMLGRLRMDVEDCIQQYWIMSTRIFRSYRMPIIRMYSRKAVQDSAKDVVRVFCRFHNMGQLGCTGREFLRQHDFEESFEQGSVAKKNGTCKVAVLTVREGGATDFQGDEKSPSIHVLFRTYNHRTRGSHDKLNPKSLHHAQLETHQACSATTAAPTYFRSVRLRGRKFVDGGVWANNPAREAWNEAILMAGLPNGNELLVVKPRMLLSIGTGRKAEGSKIGLCSLMRFAFNAITDTEKAHNEVSQTVRDTPGSDYFRFSVPENAASRGVNGLHKIGLADCKKTRTRSIFHRNGGAPILDDQAQTNDAVTIEQAVENARRRDDTLRLSAARSATNTCGFDPQKFTYTTFDKIRDRTTAYLYSSDENQELIQSLVEECAQVLRRKILERKRLTPERFNTFRTHPDPAHRNSNTQPAPSVHPLAASQP